MAIKPTRVDRESMEGLEKFQGAMSASAQSADLGAVPGERLSREQETRANGNFHRTWDDMQEGDFTMRSREDMLKAPEPRAGYAQRWISVEANGVSLADNLASRVGEGWLPRPVHSIPANFPVPTISDGKFTGFVGVRGMVLMERPLGIHVQAVEEVRSKTRRQMQAVEAQLAQTHEASKPGLGAPRLAAKTDVVKGRIPTVAEDED